MTRRQDTSLPNNHHLVISTSGGGKSTWLKARPEIKRARRLLAWDPDEEYNLPHYRSAPEFLAAVKAAGSGPIRAALSVDPTREAFEWWAGVVFAVASSDRPSVALAEEIADVTTVSKASKRWGMLCRRGRKYGVTIYAVTQRPEECDKTIYSQAAYKWVGFIEDENTIKRVARVVKVPAEEVAALEPLQFILKGPGPGNIERGRVRVPRRRKK